MGRSPGILAAALLALACGACKTEDGYWTFCATRSVWGTDFDANSWVHDKSAVWGAILVLTVPVAVDVVFLPVALPHDIWYVD